VATTPAPPKAPPKPTWDPRRPAPPLPWLRPTIRIRLTLLYGGMFLIAGILLLSIIYLLAAEALNARSPATSATCPTRPRPASSTTP
jgi:hypothetical protein